VTGACVRGIPPFKRYDSTPHPMGNRAGMALDECKLITAIESGYH
jgi:hypothetical protein